MAETTQQVLHASRVPTNVADVGVIGMGVMGTNLARNMARNGFTVAIWNRFNDRTDAVLDEFGHEGHLIGCYTLEDFVAALKSPRAMIMMIKAGQPIDQMNQRLLPLIDPGDIIVDAGNSLFTDTRRREQELAVQGFNFVGIGVSGGEVGALEGPSIMPGGSATSYQRLGPILEKIAAHVPNSAGGSDPCCAWMGPDGAGHFVKMVHNGIEYADMQLISEAYALLQAAGLNHQEMAETFRQWNHTDLNSYLIEITASALEKVDAKTGRPLVDLIVDQAGMKGTGGWTVETAVQLGSPVNAIAAAVFARSMSSQVALRQAAQTLSGPHPSIQAVDQAEFIEQVRQALWASKVVAYAQGLDEIAAGSAHYGWDIDIATVAKIWRDGCIIRAKLLGRIAEEYSSGGVSNLMVAPAIAAELGHVQQPWRNVVALAAQAGVAAPGFSAALGYYDTLRSPRLPAALLQELRDYFGSHTYQRVDEPGIFHTQWSTDGTEVKWS